MTSLPSYNDLPALEPPPGVEPNLINPYSKGFVLITVLTVFFALMILFLGFRVYSKVFLIKKFFPDDITCFLAALGTTACYITSIIEVVDGPVGKHQWDVTVGESTSKVFIVDTTYLNIVLLSPTLLVAKLTFLLFYLQIFKPFRWMKICCYLGIVLTTSFYIATWIVQLYMSTPKHGQTWVTHFESAEELAIQHISVAFSAVGLGIDVYLLILPIGAVIQLQLPWQRKIGVTLIFLTGLLACITSALSLYFRVLNIRTTDTTWELQNVVIVVLLEPLIGVIVSCMPSAAKVFSHHISSYKFVTSFSPRIWLSSKSSFSSLFKNRSQNNTDNLPVHEPSSKSSQPSNLSLSARNDASGSLRSYTKRENQQPLSYELNNLNSISTFIRTGNKKEFQTADDDRIHLKQEIWQVNK